MAYLEDDANFYMWCSQQLYSYFQMSQVVNLYQYRESHLLYMFTITVANSEMRPLLEVQMGHENICKST